MSIKLGPAGGALLVGFCWALWPIGVPHVCPGCARNILRELGLMLFLSGAGANAGRSWSKVSKSRGAACSLAGARSRSPAFAVTFIITT